MMTRKEYERAAAIIREAAKEGRAAPLLDAFVTFFQGDNPRFDSHRFRNACAEPPPAPKVKPTPKPSERARTFAAATHRAGCPCPACPPRA